MKLKRLSLWHQPLTSYETYYMADGKIGQDPIGVTCQADLILD